MFTKKEKEPPSYVIPKRLNELKRDKLYLSGQCFLYPKSFGGMFDEKVSENRPLFEFIPEGFISEDRDMLFILFCDMKVKDLEHRNWKCRDGKTIALSNSHLPIYIIEYKIDPNRYHPRLNFLSGRTLQEKGIDLLSDLTGHPDEAKIKDICAHKVDDLFVTINFFATFDHDYSRAGRFKMEINDYR